MSASRAEQLKEYAKRRRVFLDAHASCEVAVVCLGERDSQDVHHRKGRSGRMLLDEFFWIASCRRCHSWIHDHPKEAKAKGLLIDRTGVSKVIR